MKKLLVTSASVVLLILLWWVLSAVIGSAIILPSPKEVTVEFFKLFSDKSFILTVGSTVLRAFLSFVIIVLSGLLFGLVAGHFKHFEWAFQPLVTVFKATPVMSVILIAFIWLKTGYVPVFSAFLMAFPIMFVQVVNGVHQTDELLNQMCHVFEIKGIKKLLNVTVPSIAPYIVTGAKQTLSMIWKVVIAAEVLTIPNYGVGRSLQLSQMNLETSRVFAWTIIAIILTATGDLILSAVLKKVVSRRVINEA